MQPRTLANNISVGDVWVCAFNILYTTRLRNLQIRRMNGWMKRGPHLDGVNQIYNRTDCSGHDDDGGWRKSVLLYELEAKAAMRERWGKGGWPDV